MICRLCEKYVSLHSLAVILVVYGRGRADIICEERFFDDIILVSKIANFQSHSRIVGSKNAHLFCICVTRRGEYIRKGVGCLLLFEWRVFGDTSKQIRVKEQFPRLFFCLKSVWGIADNLFKNVQKSTFVCCAVLLLSDWPGATG